MQRTAGSQVVVLVVFEPTTNLLGIAEAKPDLVHIKPATFITVGGNFSVNTWLELEFGQGHSFTPTS